MARKSPRRKPTASKPPSPDESRRRGRIALYLFFVLVACLAAGADFVDQRRPAPIYPSPALTKTGRLSDYLPSLRGGRGDSDVYIFEGKRPGGTLLILGGTHPNEPASNVVAVLMVENLQVEQGQIIIIPLANASGFSATEPQEAFPLRFHFINRSGRQRDFRVGSRFTNILDGWPDPIVYRHHPSGQILSGNETRNLNRAYPGRPNGTLTERVAWAITELVRREEVDLMIDMHEAAPEYPVVNAVVAHERAMDIAAMAVVELQICDLDFRLEPSPKNFHGLSHREVGDFTPAKVMLFESTGALQGRLRATTDAELVTRSKDALYHRADRIGKLQVEFPAEGVPIEVRVGRHLEAIRTVCKILGEFEPDQTIDYSRIPGYDELQHHGVGFYLN